MRFPTIFSLLLLMLLSGPLLAQDTSTRIEGKIQTAGPSIFMQGSHELVDAEGELVARLSGSANDVDLASHEGKWVCLTGEWKPTVEAGGQIFEVKSVGAVEAKPDKN